MHQKTKKQKTSLEVYESIRRDWNGVNPVTKVIPDKRESKNEKEARKEEKNYVY